MYFTCFSCFYSWYFFILNVDFLFRYIFILYLIALLFDLQNSEICLSATYGALLTSWNKYEWAQTSQLYGLLQGFTWTWNCFLEALNHLPCIGNICPLSASMLLFLRFNTVCVLYSIDDLLVCKAICIITMCLCRYADENSSKFHLDAYVQNSSYIAWITLLIYTAFM